MEIKVNIEQSQKETITIDSLVNLLNSLVESEFFFKYSANIIRFAYCSNKEYHNRLLTMIGLHFSQKRIESYIGYGYGGGGGEIHIANDGELKELYRFIESLGRLENINIVID